MLLPLSTAVQSQVCMIHFVNDDYTLIDVHVKNLFIILECRSLLPLLLIQHLHQLTQYQLPLLLSDFQHQVVPYLLRPHPCQETQEIQFHPSWVFHLQALLVLRLLSKFLL